MENKEFKSAAEGSELAASDNTININQVTENHSKDENSVKKHSSKFKTSMSPILDFYNKFPFLVAMLIFWVVIIVVIGLLITHGLGLV
ncbi:hypothetical protein [[Mycoplasma] testudinis]|uniref:hypothetical protein n=1 Tax=[Mycoplasma] testudinis TaxID=33924 RepID=UPI00047F3795|nr:hypothetical protein [[Mycoplasma] testudinis]